MFVNQLPCCSELRFSLNLSKIWTISVCFLAVYKDEELTFFLFSRHCMSDVIDHYQYHVTLSRIILREVKDAIFNFLMATNFTSNLGLIFKKSPFYCYAIVHLLPPRAQQVTHKPGVQARHCPKKRTAPEMQINSNYYKIVTSGRFILI